jgi:hypothetical protein|tara:strand:- start:514 stop:636 length:123 start_codon:yes stop_codon:yes gene_type:complete
MGDLKSQLAQVSAMHPMEQQLYGQMMKGEIGLSEEPNFLP